jgi:phage major head subunit gpT-like protein
MGLPVYSPQQLRKDVSGLFIESLMSPRPPSLVSRIATEIKSTSDRENYAWLGESPSMVEFKDSLQHKGLSEADVDDSDGTANTGGTGSGYELRNATYEATLKLRREDEEDEKTGGLAQRVSDLAGRAQSNPDKLLIEKLVLGGTSSGTCYLGTAATAEYAFSATHAARGQQTATWSNLYTRTGTSTATAQADISGTLGYLYNMKDEANEPMNEALNSIFILYPPAMNQWITEAVNAGIVSSTSNVQFSAHNIELIMCPRLTATSASNYYIGFNDPGIVRGLIYQNRQDPRFEKIGEGSDTYVDRREVVYTVNSRGVAGFGRVQRLVYVYA